MHDQGVVTKDANRDPITGAPGAHPIGTGLGAVGGGATGAVVGGVFGGPLGAVIGAAIGGATGGLAGHGAAELANPTVEDAYWRANYPNRPYATSGVAYDQYAPAYRYGWESRDKYAGQKFEDVENDLERGWETAKDKSRLGWNEAKTATRDAWHRIETKMPGDADGDGR